MIPAAYAYVCTLLLYVAVLLLFFDCRGTYFTCDPLVIDDVLHNVQSEWYALTLVLENLVMHVHFLCYYYLLLLLLLSAFSWVIVLVNDD